MNEDGDESKLMRARVCATVAARTMAELRAERDRVAAAADLVELRLDFVDRPDVAGALTDRRGPVIVTCRPSWEGGQFRGSEEERGRLLRDALALGAEYVDLEWPGGFEQIIRDRGGRNIVLSTHDFESFPDDLPERFRAMRATGAEVVKIACRAARLMDLPRLMDLDASADGLRVFVAMGSEGLASRLLPDRFGSCWTYAGDEVAPGQVSLSRMLDEFRVRQVSDATLVYGVVGKPLSHSLSPVMHNAGFAERGIDAVYIPLEAADAGDFFDFATRIGLRGASVTAPYKQQVASRLSEQDDLSRRVGAVNTVKVTETGWTGINTDVPGFLDPLSSRMPLHETRATILGAGGAARGVAVALADAGATVSVSARHADRAAEVSRQVGATVSSFPPPAGSWDLLVNTTPLGTYPAVDESPMPDGPFDGSLVYDLVYNPPVTRLMEAAAAAGCDTIGGLDMLVGQAVRQFEWWTGEPAPRKIFRRVAETRLTDMVAAPSASR